MKQRGLNICLLLAILISCELGFIHSQNKGDQNILLGAYYFDGWTLNSPHITPILRKSYREREPKWGWVTSSQNIIDKQILEASNAGLAFFSFCWYTNNENQTNVLNNALQLFHKSKYNSRLKFCLLVANHEGSYITPENWEHCTDQWIKEFASKQYLKVDEKPLIIFFSIENLIKMFGSPGAVKLAFDSFRSKALKGGLHGLSIAGCVTTTSTSLSLSEQCGFNLVTGYNYHGSAFHGQKQKIPIDSMQTTEYKVWNFMSQWSRLPYIPVSTLNWDPRPWANERNGYNEAHYFVGYSQKSVYKSVSQIIDWLKNNPKNTPKERIGLLYAWNENGEGAYLTPSRNGDNMLKGVTKALHSPITSSQKP
ncbi:glycoside hydrolase family 99-like domain-containing protein [Dyadobacter sp. LJ53]|uniref:glycoside hydrolase family 99-like domain-containing protein n=1 Tax=Dyadobacter chenwenxiniae TaxID=2906456 RepID=UPI001F4701EC|nr:glycoside hydrolase family 99-like domain-containing protein [Dyadobacter chenwenxiniae]MCF0048436.1 glycoside hydrolase family 99-like domain-containing protein [Dyadobacter chenwenxiniae]